MVGAVLALALQLGSVPGQFPPAQLLVDVQVIEASNRPQSGPPPTRAIRDLARTLHYRSYRTVLHEQRLLSLGEDAQIVLPDGALAHISPLAVEQRHHQRTVRVRVRIQQGKELLAAEYSVRDGGTVFVSSGRQRTSDSALVLAIIPHVGPPS